MEKKNKWYTITLIALIAIIGIGSFWIENSLTYAIILISIGLMIYLLFKFFLWIMKIL